PGKITDYFAPGGHGVRVDSHAYAGYVIPPYYDSMIGKLIVSAFSREEVIDKMIRALDEFIIEGVKTTIPFHQKLMRDPRFRRGEFSTRFMETFKF
ncbi:MAG: acetyl-CoA carboxylase biotin carboxylase subunit, partial [Bacteroidia bacterium]|nr:acetyl-CoA carboxylase biotin carboxylase subunit [Bacteroidia bacterium]